MRDLRTGMRHAILAATCALAAACGGTRATPDLLPGTESGVVAAQRDSARLPYTEADVTFMREMIGHHAQAIEMSRMAPTHEASPAIRTLAARIINAQRDEIALMRTWLLDRRRAAPSVDSNGIVTPAAPEAGDPSAGHAMHAGHHAMMAGMLTPEQMTELAAARGERFDELFLTRMIGHHRGAVTMVQTLLGSRGAAQDETVFRLAADIEVDQSTEIRRMVQMLLEMGATPPA